MSEAMTDADRAHRAIELVRSMGQCEPDGLVVHPDNCAFARQVVLDLIAGLRGRAAEIGDDGPDACLMRRAANAIEGVVPELASRLLDPNTWPRDDANDGE
jgi:hypothetical protein